MKTEQRFFGDTGEAAIVEYLQNEGYDIYARNFQTRGGEVDIIARKGEVLAFVEVKTRRVESFALSEVVTISKQRKIIRAARAYLFRYRMSDVVIRFDVAILTGDARTWKLNYIPNAFTAPEGIV